VWSFHVAASVRLARSAAACGPVSSEATVGSESPVTSVASPTPTVGASAPSRTRFDPSLFGDDSATVDNEWFPLVPTTRYGWEAHAFEDDGQRIDRRVVFTVTDREPAPRAD
jgi:hypothetical protein